MKKFLLGSILLCFVCACSSDAIEEDIPVNPKPVSPSIDMTTPEFVFGFVGESKYSYCPSVLKQEDGTVHLYFCGNPNNLIMVDNIYHVKINPDGTRTNAKSVLQPGVGGSWDDHHTCDPSVIEGSFNWGGTNYRYAMFFLSNAYAVYYNEVGVAFSNDLEADSWVKYPTQIARKTWSEDGDQYYGSGFKSWGVGQPSAVSLDGKGKV